MSEMVVNFNEIQKTLEPLFGNRYVRIVVQNDAAVISADNANDIKKLKARGIARQHSNPSLIEGEKGAWERAAVEKHEERFGGKCGNS
jgi:hypothetical protein